MGRGRAKAKQTKVARQLKYTARGTDLSRCTELGAPTEPPNGESFRTTTATTTTTTTRPTSRAPAGADDFALGGQVTRSSVRADLAAAVQCGWLGLTTGESASCESRPKRRTI